MRILFIVNELLYTCGVSNHVYNLLKGLKDQHEVEIILLCGGGKAIEKYKELGIRVIVVEEIRHESRSLIKYCKGLIKLYKIIKSNHIDIVHSHHHYAANMAQKIKYITGVRTILTNHGILPEIGLLNHFTADYIVAVNEHVVNYLIEKKIKEHDKIILIRSGTVNHNYNQFPLETKNKLKILAASRFVAEKGNDIYIQAIAELDNSYKNKADFYLAGEGEMQKELANLNEKLNANVKFLGRIENLSEKLYQYDIFIMPSISRAEGYPLVMIEAGKAKCIIITSNFYGIEYIFKDNTDGYIFTQSDYKQLSEQIKYVIDNFSKSQELAQNYFRKVTTLFDLDKMVNETIALYQKCFLS